MSTDERIRNRRSFRNPMFFIGITMTVFYIMLGTWLLVDSRSLPEIPSEFRTVFAAMVLIYGLYRGWRAWADYKKNH